MGTKRRHKTSKISIIAVRGTAGSEVIDSYTDEGEKQIGGQTALWFHAKPEAGARWDSPTGDIYLIGGEDGFFTITVSCYLEASEGWGARMSAMIDTFLPA